RCLIALSLITGQVGRPGTGLHPLRGQNNVQGASDAGLIPMFYPDYQSVEGAAVRAKFETLWQTPLDDKRGLTVVEIMDAVHRDEIKGMYIMGENPAMSDPDVEHAREALAHLEHLVVQDIFLTETAKYADVVLPASAWPEKDGTVTNTNRQVQMGRTALPLPGNAQQDWWIIQEIARRIGLAWSYTHPRDVFAEMKQAMPSLNGITWERLQRESSVTYPCDSESEPGHDIVFGDGAIAPGMVFIPFCYAEAAANVLTNPQLDPFGKIPEYKFCAARVEPADSRAAAELRHFSSRDSSWFGAASAVGSLR